MNEIIYGGVEISELEDSRLKKLTTNYAKSIISGLEKSGIPYSAKYNNVNLTLAYSAENEMQVESILRKATSDVADVIERLRMDSGSTDEFLALLPEIAKIMDISASSLKNRPIEVQLILTHTYVNNWFCDDITIREELKRITELGYSAQNELKADLINRADENNTPEKRKEISDVNMRLDRAAEQERMELKQQQDMISQEENRVKSGFNLAVLHREIEKVRQQSNDNATHRVAENFLERKYDE